MSEESAIELPDGEYAIVECLGHRKMVGRITEVTRVGVAMLQVEQILDGALGQSYFVTGASIYCLTPCTKEQALKHGLISCRRTLVSVAHDEPEEEHEDDGDREF